MERRFLFRRIFKMRVGQADVPDWQFRRYLLVFFFLAAALFLWAPTRWLMETFYDFSIFRSAVGPDILVSPAEAPSDVLGLPGQRFLEKRVSTEGTLVKKPRRVVFRLFAPAAQVVYLGGTFNGFDARQTPLTKRLDGVWETTLDIVPGRYLYKFKVDGQWELDPTNPEKTSEPRTSSILHIQ